MVTDFKKIAVLGSNSFTGSHFVDHVLKNTDSEVLGISRSEEYKPIFLPYLYLKKRSDRFKFAQYDLNKDLEKIIGVLDAEKPEVIVNFAAQGEVRNSWKWPEQWFETNCMAVVRLADKLKERDYLKRYLNVSTPEVYGNTGRNISESHHYKPSTPYASSKLAGDIFLMNLFKRYNFPVVSTRSANVYGIHQQLYRIIPRTIIYLKSNRTIELHGGGEALRSFIHARDVADGTLRAIKHGRNGEFYHLATEKEELKIRDIVHKICDMMSYDFDRSTISLSENFGQDSIFSLDSSKARKELGWKPEEGFDKGISEMIRWIDKEWETIKTSPLDYVHKD